MRDERARNEGAEFWTGLRKYSMASRIVTDPKILSGKPCIQGTRLSVEFILELIASGGSQQEIVKAYPQLTVDDVAASVRYAAAALKNDRVVAI
jgi:uncharacterized protein (DUF433 family)